MVKQKERSTLELIPILFIVIFAIIVYDVPRLSDVLVYDRRAILSGEVWRLLTAPMVHFSASHLFWDAAVFGVAGLAINGSGFRGLWRVCIFTTIIPGLVFLLSSPELEHYGGLSGLATGAAAYYCLCRAHRSGNNRIIWLLILAAMGIKIIIEAVTGVPIFSQVANIPFRVLPSVHLVGYLGAFATFIWSWLSRSGTRRRGNFIIAGRQWGRA